MESPIYLKILAWCEANPNVRTVVLTSSWARNDDSRDALSDYDLELYVRDGTPFGESDSWLEQPGEVLVRWPLGRERGIRAYMAEIEQAPLLV